MVRLIPDLEAGPAAIRAQVLAAWPGDDVWAARTTHCESVGYTDFYNEGSGASGVWQFLLSTWRLAGQTGSPNDYSITHQTKVAWQWLKRTSSGQWECSPYSYDP